MKEDKKLNMSQQVIEKRNISVLQKTSILKQIHLKKTVLFNLLSTFFFDICCAVQCCTTCRSQKTWESKFENTTAFFKKVCFTQGPQRCIMCSPGKLFRHSPELSLYIEMKSFLNSHSYTKSLVNTNLFYTSFTNTHFQKVPIHHLTHTMKQKFLH